LFIGEKMKKLEDKENLTRFDYFIYYKRLKEEAENDSKLLDENKLYLTKLETTIQEKNYEIKQLSNDYDETSKLLALKIRDLERVTKQVNKVSNKLEKTQNMVKKQQKTIEKLNVLLSVKNDENRVLNDRLAYCHEHLREDIPNIEELKAYVGGRKKVLNNIRGKQNATK